MSQCLQGSSQFEPLCNAFNDVSAGPGQRHRVRDSSRDRSSIRTLGGVVCTMLCNESKVGAHSMRSWGAKRLAVWKTFSHQGRGCLGVDRALAEIGEERG